MPSATAALGAQSGAETEPPRAARRGLFALAAFGSLLVPGIFQAGVVPQELASILEEYRLSEESFGLLAAGVALAATVLGLSAAWAVPRLGLYHACLLGYGLFAAGLAGVCFAPFGPAALAAGLLTALGMAYLHLGNGLVVQLAPHRAASMTNLLHGFNALGKAIGPLFALLGKGWRAPFLAVGALAAALGLAGLLGRAPARAATPADDEAPAGEALREPLFWLCAAVFIPLVGMEQVVVLWLPKHLQSGVGLGAEAGSAAALAGASAILWAECAGRFLAPLALRRAGPLWLLAACVPLTLAILAGTEFGCWTGPGGLAAQALCGLGFSAPWPTFFALACRAYPRHKGLLSVASGAATSLAFIAFSALGGYLGTRAGLAWTLRLSPALAFLALGGAVAVALVTRRREAKEV